MAHKSSESCKAHLDYHPFFIVKMPGSSATTMRRASAGKAKAAKHGSPARKKPQAGSTKKGKGKGKAKAKAKATGKNRSEVINEKLAGGFKNQIGFDHFKTDWKKKVAEKYKKEGAWIPKKVGNEFHYIFDDKEGAEECQQWVADGCPSHSAPSPVKIFKPRGERTLKKIVQNVSQLQASGAASHPYAGKTASGVAMPIIINGAFRGMQMVDVTFVLVSGVLHAEYSHQSQTVKTAIDEAEARRILGVASNNTYPIQLE